jgi:hypothetical protein
MRIVSVILPMMFFSLFAAAQDPKGLKAWHATAAGTLLNGNTRTGAAVTFQVERVWKDRWTFGMGSGIDHYQFRSVPLFTSVKRYWKHTDRGLFFYGEGGINLPWPTDDQRYYRQGGFWGWGSIAQPSSFDPGVWMDLGIGYGFKSKRGHGLFLRAGQSVKTLGQRYNEQVWNGTSTVTAARDINYLFGRLAIQAGFRF